jgi:hypothetical protein
LAIRASFSLKKLQLVLLLTIGLSFSGCSTISAYNTIETKQPTSIDIVTSTVIPIALEESLETQNVPKIDTTPVSTILPVVTPTSIPYSYGPDNFPYNVNPLTGLHVEDPNLLDRRPLAIKISNYPRDVRPQSGLSLADIAYEYYLEQNVTRFIGIFYGNNADKVGPVRSGRFFDEHIFRIYEALYVFAMADDRLMDYFMELEKSVINRFIVEHPEDKQHTCGVDENVPLCRDREIKSWNNMFANTKAIQPIINNRPVDNVRQDLSGMRFEEAVPSGGIPGEKIDVYYSVMMYNLWVYDQNSGRYLRFDDAHEDNLSRGKEYQPLMDKLTNAVIAADNVAVIFVPHYFYLKSSDTEIIQIDLLGSGEAILFRNGMAYPALWERPENSGVLTLKNPDGELLPFKPGVTFFIVMTPTTEIAHDSAEWFFEFGFPELEPTQTPINPLP